MGAFIAAFCWQPLSGGVLIGAEAGRMTSRVGESLAPKYGGFSACPRKGMRLWESGRRDAQIRTAAPSAFANISIRQSVIVELWDVLSMGSESFPDQHPIAEVSQARRLPRERSQRADVC